jgi:hypothetical protein
MRQFGRQKQHIEQCTVVKNRRLHEVGKRYRRSATVCRMTGYFLIVERICYVAITALPFRRRRRTITKTAREAVEVGRTAR